MLQQEKLQRYRALIEKYNVLPVGRGQQKKAPCLSGWQLNPNLSLEQICSYKDAIALGLTTENLWVLDIDGDSAVRWARSKGLLDGEFTWEVHRTTSPYYYKRIFKPTAAQIAEIPENQDGLQEFQFKVRTNPTPFLNEAAEFFMAHNRQIIFYGKHWKSGGDYYSPPHKDFGDIREPTTKEWKVVIDELSKREEKLPRASSRSLGRDWNTLSFCPICGRSENDNPVCQLHRDGNTIRCFEGITYHPPKNLTPGQVIHENWAFCRSQYVGWGDFAIFTKHQPDPIQLSFRRWRK